MAVLPGALPYAVVRATATDLLLLRALGRQSAAQLQAALALQTGWMGVARATGGAALGFLELRWAVDEAEVVDLYVAPPARSQGVARALLVAGLTALRGRGVHRFFLEVAENNAPAQALYARLGFVPVGRRPRYYPAGTPGGTDAVILRLCYR